MFIIRTFQLKFLKKMLFFVLLKQYLPNLNKVVFQWNLHLDVPFVKKKYSILIFSNNRKVEKTVDNTTTFGTLLLSAFYRVHSCRKTICSWIPFQTLKLIHNCLCNRKQKAEIDFSYGFWGYTLGVSTSLHIKTFVP